MSRLVAVGLSFRTAPVAVRERASLDEGAARLLLRALRAGGAVREALALSTCNRTELYALADDPVAGERALLAALAAHTAIGAEQLRRCAFAVAD
ncbi:MAG TPA: glutamyl-tRNA reductase, partial [Solirubrobacteraceae bacterium]|nr:glutamyl-tRNA reductase [Solirubrobacteraceae bacterium]